MKENRTYFTVVGIIAVLPFAGLFASRLGWETFFAAVDLLLLRVVLVCFLYLLWRLVKAYEERVRIDRLRLEADRGPVAQPRSKPDPKQGSADS